MSRGQIIQGLYFISEFMGGFWRISDSHELSFWLSKKTEASRIMFIGRWKLGGHYRVIVIYAWLASRTGGDSERVCLWGNGAILGIQRWKIMEGKNHDLAWIWHWIAPRDPCVKSPAPRCYWYDIKNLQDTRSRKDFRPGNMPLKENVGAWPPLLFFLCSLAHDVWWFRWFSLFCQW